MRDTEFLECVAFASESDSYNDAISSSSLFYYFNSVRSPLRTSLYIGRNREGNIFFNFFVQQNDLLF